MGFKESVSQKYAETFYEKNKDRLTQVQGKILQCKVERKTVLWIFHKLAATILVKPAGSRNIVKCEYIKKRWFKQVKFVQISQGHSVIIQGLKGKKDKKGKSKGNRETISIMNIRNLTNKTDLVPVNDANMKVQKVRDKRFK